MSFWEGLFFAVTNPIGFGQSVAASFATVVGWESEEASKYGILGMWIPMWRDWVDAGEKELGGLGQWFQTWGPWLAVGAVVIVGVILIVKFGLPFLAQKGIRDLLKEVV